MAVTLRPTLASPVPSTPPPAQPQGVIIQWGNRNFSLALINLNDPENPDQPIQVSEEELRDIASRLQTLLPTLEMDATTVDQLDFIWQAQTERGKINGFFFDRIEMIHPDDPNRLRMPVEPPEAMLQNQGLYDLNTHFTQRFADEVPEIYVDESIGGP